MARVSNQSRYANFAHQRPGFNAVVGWERETGGEKGQGEAEEERANIVRTATKSGKLSSVFRD